MATVVHGVCSSPRQQHQCDLAAGAGGCLAAGHHPHQHAHQAATPIYSGISKYLRPNTAPQLSAPHPHIYDGSSINAVHGQLQFGTPLNQISYIPISHASPPLQHSYGTVQLTSAAPIVSGSGEMCRNYWTHSHAATMTYGNGVGGGVGGVGGISGSNGRHNSKRKSAVQLLAESKPMYMQPEPPPIIMDRLQATASPAPSFRKNFLTNSNLKRGRSSVPPSGREQIKYNASYGGGLTSSHSSGDVERRFFPRPLTTREAAVAMQGAHLHHQHYHNHNATLSRHGTPTYNNNLIQNKMKLMIPPDASPRERLSMGPHGSELPRKFDFNPPMVGENCRAESILPYMHTKEIVALPPPMFLSTPNFEDNYSYAAGETSSIDEPLVLTDDYRPISPPAEYAEDATHTDADIRSRYNYQRSYSHSHEVTDDGKYDANAFNINSHKSLPDLHSQISRHSPHSEILSCCSRGNRSIKSTGESSLNRDSGGSSGHYTHRSEPCYRQRDAERESYEPSTAACCNHAVNAAAVVAPVEFRRDSGSSTQHSANSYCGYASPAAYGRSAGAECVVCRCNRSASAYEANCDYMLNFPTPIVPEAFQDDYRPPSPQLSAQNRLKLEEMRYYSATNIDHRAAAAAAAAAQQQSQQFYGISPHSLTHASLRLPQSACNAQSPGSTPSMEDISPPPIQFKRQKCIRLKNRNRLPVPNAVSVCNSASAVNGSSGAASYSNAEPQAFLFPKCIAASGSAEDYNRARSYGNNSRRPSCEKVTTTPPLPVMQPCNIGVGPLPDYEYPYNQCHFRDINLIADLEHFFDRLGLNDDKFFEIYAAPRRRHTGNGTDSDDSSTVFFSDVSTVDSMRLPDSTETQPQIAQPYRPSEPPSIVERNARIIKWLCNIRKLERF